MKADDQQLIGAFLEMMAAEAGAATNTLLAYQRDCQLRSCHRFCRDEQQCLQFYRKWQINFYISL